MALTVVYSNAFGGVVAENRGGTVSTYVRDTLGSTIGLMNSSGTLTDRWEYWPYGEVVSRTGTNATPFTFLGVIGYFQDVLAKLFYVRARHLRVDLARWLTVDPLWPRQPAYVYATAQPMVKTDPSGLICYSPLPWINPFCQCCNQKNPLFPATGPNAAACCSTAGQNAASALSTAQGACSQSFNGAVATMVGICTLAVAAAAFLGPIVIALVLVICVAALLYVYTLGNPECMATYYLDLEQVDVGVAICLGTKNSASSLLKFNCEGADPGGGGGGAG